jgi:hypothetical protein
MQDPMAVATLGQSDTAARATDSLTQMHNIEASCLGADSR